MAKAMEHGALYTDLRSRAELQFQCALKIIIKDLQKNLQAISDDVLADFDRTFVVQENNDPDREALRRDLLAWVDRAKARLDGPLRQDLSKAIADSSDVPKEDIGEFVDSIDSVGLFDD